MVTACFVIAAPARQHINPTESASIESDSILNGHSLPDQCVCVEQELRALLPREWHIQIREPFVVCGDLSADGIETSFRETIFPTARALQQQYFQTSLSRPITVILCSSDEVFRQCNWRLDQNERSEYSGIYSRRHRRVIVNVSTGEGTLAHELTHALAHADFPKMPEWFDEGLASLHEECEFSHDGQRLLGLDNWRVQAARDAIQRGELRLLQDVTSTRFATRDRATADYAYARSLCLYLQERGLLETFYQACQQATETDPSGLRTLCQVTKAAEPKELEDAFRTWLLERTHSTF